MTSDGDVTLAVPVTGAARESLLIVAGVAEGLTIPLAPGELVLGREVSGAGRLGGDPGLSRRHAVVRNDGRGRLTVEDLGSTNGTLVNGVRAGGERVIGPGDVLQLGGSRLLVQAPDRLGADGGTDPGWQFGGDVAEVGPEDWPAGHGSPAPAVSNSPGLQSNPQTGRAVVRGEVRNIQHRVETRNDASFTVVTFRLERYEPGGDRMRPVPVQLRGFGYDGALHEGDEVSVEGEWNRGTLYVTTVENHSTGASVNPRRGVRPAVAVAAFGGVLLIGLLGFAVVVTFALIAFLAL